MPRKRLLRLPDLQAFYELIHMEIHKDIRFDKERKMSPVTQL